MTPPTSASFQRSDVINTLNSAHSAAFRGRVNVAPFLSSRDRVLGMPYDKDHFLAKLIPAPITQGTAAPSKASRGGRCYF